MYHTKRDVPMRSTNIADLRSNLSQLLADVERGEEVEVCKRNVPIARIVPSRVRRTNKTKLGCGAGTVVVMGDLTEPAIPADDWEMLED